jgi:hypothetical protein
VLLRRVAGDGIIAYVHTRDRCYDF